MAERIFCVGSRRTFKVKCFGVPFGGLFATLLVAAHVLVVSGDAKLRFKMSRELLLSAISGVFLAAHFLTWMESLFYIPVSLSTTIVVTYPLLAMLYEAILGISKPTKEEIVGAVMPSLGWL